MDEEIKKKFAELEAKIAALEAENKNLVADVCHYIEKHGKEHGDLIDLVIPAYCKNHPEHMKAMEQFRDIAKPRFPLPPE